MRRGSSRNRLFDYWFGIPALGLLSLLHRRRSPPANPRRIGLMCSPALGDTLLFSAVLQDVRAAFPQAQLVHICMKQNLAAAEIIPGADERLVIALTQPAETLRALRAQHFDVLLDFTSWQRLTAFYSLFSGAQYTVGFQSPGQYRSRGYDRTVLHRSDQHEVENFRALLAGSGLLDAAPPVPHAPAVVVEPPAPPPLVDEPDLIAFHLWASGQRSWLREWPEDRWVELARRLALPPTSPPTAPQTLFLITGAPSDRPRIEPFVQRLRDAGLRAEPFVSPDGFRTLTHVLRRCRLVVSVNTGVMHLAAVAGAPTLSLNGPTAEHRWGARGSLVGNVQPADGSGGYLHLGFEFEGQPEDVIDRISVDQVFAAAEQLQAAATAPEAR